MCPLRQNSRVPPFFGVPRLANHSAPPKIIGGTLASVSALLMTVGPPHSPTTAGKGGRMRGTPRLPSSDSILADFVSSCASMPVHFEVTAAAENVFAGESLGVGVGNRLLHDIEQIAILAANVNVSGAGPDRKPGNHHAFNHRMRIVFEDEAVLAGAGFALIAIAQNIFRLCRSLRNE